MMAVVALVGVGLPSLGSLTSAAAKPPRLPGSTRASRWPPGSAALLGAMTLAEKVGQMDQQLVTTLTDTDSARCGDNGFNLPNADCMQKILIDAKTGSVLAGGTNNPIDTTGNGRGRQHRLRLGQRVQHDPEVRDQELAAAHPA